MLHLSLWLLKHTFACPLRQVSIRSMQYVLAALQYEEAYSYST